ncbi:MAG TPA: DUF1326 domain-containing protein [Burkholderiales bacterium]|nr:DUF1326 domain-containing protein [Burkholderiales bacterium]
MNDLIRRQWLKAGAALAAFSVLPSRWIGEAEAAEDRRPWKVSGSYLESCNCAAACPCIFGSAPTQGNCTALIGWHIDEGRFGDVKLDGLNAALAVQSSGHMLQSKWRVALYLDERGNEKQRNALAAIFSGQAGGHMSVLAGFIGEVMGVQPAKLEYVANGRMRSMQIQGIAQMEIEAMKGQGGGTVLVSGNPVAVVPATPAVVATSRSLRYRDHDLSWELSGRNGFYSPFTYQA